MKFNTALSFILLGAALWIRIDEGDGGTPRIVTITSRRLALGCAVFAVLISLISGFEYAMGWNAGIDQLFIKADVPSRVPGRMAMSTAMAFVLAGSGLLSLDAKTRRGFYPAQFMALASALIGLFCMTGYLYGVKAFYTIGPLGVISAFPSAICLFLLGLGIMLARPAHSLMATFQGERCGAPCGEAVVTEGLAGPRGGEDRYCGRVCRRPFRSPFVHGFVYHRGFGDIVLHRLA